MSDAGSSVGIIVVNHNTPELVKQLIESIKMQTRDVDYELVVVNNGCTAAGTYQAGGSTFVRTIESPENIGFGAAVNVAARTCTNEFLLLANSDCELDSNLIPRMIKFLRQNIDYAACTPRTVYPDGRTHSNLRRFPDYKNIRGSRGAVLRTRDDYTIEADETRKEAEAVAATFLLLYRSDFEEMRGFDERFFMYVEDTDLCRRLHDAGRKVGYLGDLKVIHHWGASTRNQRLRMKFYHHQSIWRYFRKHYPRQTRANAWLAVQLVGNYLLTVVKVLIEGVGKPQ